MEFPDNQMNKMISYLVLAICVGHVTAPAAPYLCNYVTESEFTCDYAGMVTPSDRPLDFTQFSPEPQQLTVSVNGYVPYYGDSETFSSTFAGINIGGFDSNFPATLTVTCGSGGSMLLSTGAFYNMSYVQRLTIKDCQTANLPANAFEDFVALDYIGFENGHLEDDVDPNAMAGLTVEKLTSATHSFPRNMGQFEIKYTSITAGSVPPGLLFNWKNLTSASFIGANLDTISGDVFKYNTKIKYIDISDNPFTSLPDSIFEDLHSLSEVRMNHIAWDCTCDNTGFTEFGILNNITLFGDFVCSSPAGTTVGKYWNDNCIVVDLCDGTIGFTAVNKCLHLFALLAYIFAVIAFITLIVCLALFIHTKRQMGQKQTRRTNAKGRWNKMTTKLNVAKKLKSKVSVKNKK